MSRGSDVAQLWHEIAEVHLTVRGTSMLPILQPGDRIAVERCGLSSLRAGDVIVVGNPLDPVVHRLLAVDGESLITRGDAATSHDPPWHACQLLGRVLARTRDDRVRALDRGLARLGGRGRAWYWWLRGRVRRLRATGVDVRERVGPN